jgi:hypothetical protein
LIESLDMAQTPLESGGDSNRAKATSVTMTGMPLDRIRYEPENHSFRVQGVDIEPIRDDVIVFPFEIVKNVSVAYLAKALERYRDVDGGYFEDVFISDTPLADFDADTASRDMRLDLGPLGLEVEGAQIVAKGEEPSPEDTQALVGPLLARHRARWVSQEETTREGGPWSVIVVRVELVPGARPVADLRALSADLSALLGAVTGGVISASAAADLIRAGHASALLGQREGSYLDAKAAPYDARGDAAAWELAKDVAAFANSGEDALVVMGISTRRDANGDVFDALRGLTSPRLTWVRRAQSCATGSCP